MSVVYFIQSGRDGPIKIGYTSKLKKRLLDISQGLPDPAVVLATISGGRELERRIHRACHASKRRLEWFNPTDEIRALVLVAAKLGLPAVERWLDGREAVEVQIRPTGFVQTDDFEADIRQLISLAFKLAVARHGVDKVAESLDRSKDMVENSVSGRTLPTVESLYKLAMLDPGAVAPFFARCGDVPEWIVKRAGEDSINELLARLPSPVRAA